MAWWGWVIVGVLTPIALVSLFLLAGVLSLVWSFLRFIFSTEWWR